MEVLLTSSIFSWSAASLGNNSGTEEWNTSARDVYFEPRLRNLHEMEPMLPGDIANLAHYRSLPYCSWIYEENFVTEPIL